MKICDYGCGKEAKFWFKSVNRWCCSKNVNICSEARKYLKKPKGKNLKLSLKMKGKVPWNKGKKNVQKSIFKGQTKDTNLSILKRNESRELNRINRLKNLSDDVFNTYNLTFLEKKHKKFLKFEDIRKNPNIYEKVEIQVRCKNSSCKFSKEKNGWFTPRRTQIYERIRQLETKKGNGKAFFYCCKECKQAYSKMNLNLENYFLYEKIVHIETERQIKKYKNKIKGIELRSRKFHVDHIFSVRMGFENGILPQIIACYKNLRVISDHENCSKFTKSDINSEKLFHMFNECVMENKCH